MDHKGLIKSSCFVCLLLLGVGCSSKSQPVAEAPQEPSGVYHAPYPRAFLTKKTEEFLSLHKGYDFLIRNPRMGMYVTAWTSYNSGERHQISLRIHDDENGSLLTTHIVTQVLGSNGWEEVANAGRQEASFINQLKVFLSHSNPTSRAQP